jgi:glycosyltransferase involved in cell wall biosynthesis
VIAVIATVFNEGVAVEGLVRSLLAQSQQPDEIVIADGGSTDETLVVLERLAAEHPSLRVVEVPGNRSQGRNAAIGAAAADIIASIDGGCVAEPQWLEALVAPFASGADWVSGGYDLAEVSLWSRCLGLVIVYVPEEMEGEGTLPSARSVAFRKSAWEKAGGFPIEASLNEDTVFAERLIDAGFSPVLATDAVVRWVPPANMSEMMRKAWEWGRGDGLAGSRTIVYKHLLAWYGGTALAASAASVWRPRASPLVLAPLAVSVAWKTRFKYRHARGGAKYILIPVAHVAANTTALAAFLRGYGERRWLGRPGTT